MIMLNVKNIKTNRSNKLLNYKNMNFFKIIKVINNMIYELNLLKKKYLFYFSFMIITFK